MQSSSPTIPSVIVGVVGSKNIADLFASNLGHTLNSHSSSSHTTLQHSIHSSITPSHLSSIVFSEDDVLDGISHIKLGKCDGDGIFSEHIFYATSVLISPLAVLFTSLLCGFMPQCLRDCVLIPVDRPIALSSIIIV